MSAGHRPAGAVAASHDLLQTGAPAHAFGGCNGLGPAVDAQRSEDAGQMALDGAHGHVEVPADLLVALALEQLAQLNQWVAFPGANYRQISRIQVAAVNEAVFGDVDIGKVMREAQERAQALMPRS